MLQELITTIVLCSGINDGDGGDGNPGYSVATTETVYNIDVESLQALNDDRTLVIGLPDSLSV